MRIRNNKPSYHWEMKRLFEVHNKWWYLPFAMTIALLLSFEFLAYAGSHTWQFSLFEVVNLSIALPLLFVATITVWVYRTGNEHGLHSIYVFNIPRRVKDADN